MLWNFLPLNQLPYIAAAANLIVVLAVVLLLSWSIRSLRKRLRTSEATAQGAVAEVAAVVAAMAELKGRVEGLDERDDLPIESSGPTVGGLNQSLRSKVLKMHRLGQPTDRIASTLGIPQGDVDLLVKIHRIVMRPYEQPTSLQPELAVEKP